MARALQRLHKGCGSSTRPNKRTTFGGTGSLAATGGSAKRPAPWSAMGIVTMASLLAMSLWFSASAVAPTLIQIWQISGSTASWLTASVQIGFVTGALLSATIGLPDLVNSRGLFVSSCFFGAVVNILFVFFGNHLALGLALRFLTGFAIAGVYPIAVKMASTWFIQARGLAISILIAGNTIGSALPQLIRGAGALEHWQAVMAGSSLSALAAGLLVWWRISDMQQPEFGRFHLGVIRRVFCNRPAMLANIGYFGHMWELYAMWTWLPLFLLVSWSHYISGAPLIAASALSSFAIIGIGGAGGAVLGGWIADRRGRTLTAIGAMTLSGSCAVLIGWTFQGPPWLTIIIAAVWGVTIIADSAQFSAAVTELSHPSLVGSAVTLQLAIGFLITVISINIIPWLEQVVGWHWAFAILSLGPALGIVAMLRLRQDEGASYLAQGRR